MFNASFDGSNMFMLYVYCNPYLCLFGDWYYTAFVIISVLCYTYICRHPLFLNFDPTETITLLSFCFLDILKNFILESANYFFLSQNYFLSAWYTQLSSQAFFGIAQNIFYQLFLALFTWGQISLGFSSLEIFCWFFFHNQAYFFFN